MGIKQLTHLYLKNSQLAKKVRPDTARNVLVSRGLKYRAWPIFQHVNQVQRCKYTTLATSA